jgi:hypothetical protein
MPRYFFHLHDGSERSDTEGTDLADMGQVRSEAVRLSSEVLRDMDERFWGHPEWTLTGYRRDRRRAARPSGVSEQAWLREAKLCSAPS